MSESEEMYLVSIAQIKETKPNDPVAVSQLASHLGIQPVSANQMVRKLEETGCLRYTPYKGVELTQQGADRASQVLRKRRLWEVFLVEQLDIGVEEAEHIACQLEHALHYPAIERLAEFLHFPSLSPQNKPIPQSHGPKAFAGDLPLSALNTNESGRVTRISADSASRRFMEQQGIKPQANVVVLATAQKGDRLIAVNQNQTTHISKSLADSIYIKPIKSDQNY